jgi:hypothetical protein
MRISLILGSVLILFAGCSAPLSTLKPDFTPLVTTPEKKGHVIFSLFDVPKGNGEQFLRFMFGFPQGIEASVFDVTDELIYLGTFQPSKGGNFIEYDAPIGKRLFMLTFPDFPKPLALDHTDFIEADIKKENTTHIALSQYGLRKMAYFTEMKIQDKNFEYCTHLTGKYDIRDENIKKYMMSEKIDENAKYFMSYCRALSNNFKFILTPNTAGYEMFDQNKIKVNAIKEKYMPEWKQNYTLNHRFIKT